MSLQDIKNLKVNLENKILESDQVMIMPHKSADFDAIASSIGMSLISQELKKDNHIVIGDATYDLDHGVQNIIEDIKDSHSIICVDDYEVKKTKDTLNILCDVNKPKLTYVQNFDKDHLAIIDHHDKDSETFDAAIEHIDTTVSSTSEMLVCLLGAYKIHIPANIANILLTGILLDTNRLSKNVSRDTMRSVTKLLEKGASMDKAGEFFTEDFNSDRRVQELVSSTKFLNYTTAVIKAGEDKEYTKEELAKAADYLLRYKVDAAYAIGNIGNGIISISARSKESVNVGDIMRELGGGGNQFSGATKLEGTTIEETEKKLQKIILPYYSVKK